MGLQRVEVREEIVQLLLGEGCADGRHHVAASQNRLAHESFVGGKSAGEKWFLEETLQTGTILARDRMRVVTGRTILLIQMASRGLLRVQSKLGVGFRGVVVAATGEDSQKDESGEK